MFSYVSCHDLFFKWHQAGRVRTYVPPPNKTLFCKTSEFCNTTEKSYDGEYEMALPDPNSVQRVDWLNESATVNKEKPGEC